MNPELKVETLIETRRTTVVVVADKWIFRVEQATETERVPRKLKGDAHQ